jgi:hypothetical protein
MIDFLISMVVLAVSVFLLVISARYGLMGARKLDHYFSQKRNSTYQGFQWHYRLPFAIGMIPEYFFAIVLGYDNYYRRNWWALKTASFISVLVFIAMLKSRTAVYSYLSLDFIQDNGLLALFTSGNFVNFMNIIAVFYTALFVLICIESIRMHGFYAPVRIFTYSILSLIMANLTVIILSLIIFATVLYIVIKIIGFFFFSSKDDTEPTKDEETAGSILKGGFREFKSDLLQWEQEEQSNSTKDCKPNKPEKSKRKRPKITRKRKTISSDEDVPRLHPD